MFAASCSPRGTSPGDSALDLAVTHYISGSYVEARDQLIGLTQTLQSDKDLATAYLYLARCYEALGDYDAAVEAYTSGMMIGGDTPFLEHLQALKGRFETDPVYVRKQPNLTRAQLACLIDTFFSGGGENTEKKSGFQDDLKDLLEPSPPDVRDHWAKEKIENVLRSGMMRVLPDSLFYPDEKVTRAAFFFIVRRAEEKLPSTHTPIEDLFPGGLEAVLRFQLGATGEQKESAFVSGEEATNVLEKLTRKVETSDG